MGWFAVVWGLTGVCLLLLSAIWRLSPHAIEAFASGQMNNLHWLFGLCWFFFMVYSEGWRGFHRGFSPRVVARAARLRQAPDPLAVTLAPLVCLGFLRATARRQRISLIVFTVICGLVVLVRLLPQPWRGLVDLGVVSGLALGLGSIFYFVGRWIRGNAPDFPADYAVRQRPDS